jgi:CxxC motif-containing protein (DUF1111 family)
MTNEQKLREVLELALADDEFMSSNTKVNKAVEALTPKDDLTRVFKTLQINARKDFNDKKEEGIPGYTNQTKDAKIREYVSSRFKKHMDAPKTSVKATSMFNAAYPAVVAPPTDGVADEEAEAA